MIYFFQYTVSADNPGERKRQKTGFFWLPAHLKGLVLSIMFFFFFLMTKNFKFKDAICFNSEFVTIDKIL